MPDPVLELRLAARALRRQPAFSLAALATLALGLGLVTAVFSLVQATLLRPLPFAEPERLVTVWETRPAEGRLKNVVNPGNYVRWREQAESFTSLAAYLAWPANLAGQGGDPAAPDRVSIGWVSGEFFSTLGVGVPLGRTLGAADESPEAPAAVVLSDGLWRRRFAADPGVLGRTLLVDGEPATIVGVAAPGFDFPTGAELWGAFRIGLETRESRGRFLRTVGRLAPGATVETAAAEMLLVADRVLAERPAYNPGWSTSVYPLTDTLFGDYRRALWILLGATGAVLLVACANLAGLLVARNTERRHQLAVRGALGAGRAAITRALLIETLLLALLGGAAGLAVAQGVLAALRRLLPVDLPGFVELSIDVRVFGFAVVTTLLAALVFGLAPAWSAARVDLAGALAAGERRGGSRRAGAARSALVVGQVALSLALVAGAGLLGRSLDRLHRSDPGLELEGLAGASIQLAGPAYAEPAARVRFFERLEERLAADPEIEAVGSISWLPLGGVGTGHGFRAADQPPPPPGQGLSADVRMATAGFAETAGLELVAGRWFDARDTAEAPGVVVIDELAARALWGDADPLGREVIIEWGEEQTGRVVGVVRNAKLERLDQEARPTGWWPLAQLPNSSMAVMLRPARSLAGAAAALRRAAAAIDPQVPVERLRTMQEVVAEGTARPRFVSALLAAFAGLALLLSAVGLYGLLAGSVAARRRELGVRTALGAAPRRLLREVVGRGVRLVAAGTLLGVPLVYAIGRAVASQLYETSPWDPAAISAAALMLLAVGVAACLAPALRAARTDPASVLRES